MEWKDLSDEERKADCLKTINLILEAIPKGSHTESLINAFIDLLVVIGIKEGILLEVCQAFALRVNESNTKIKDA